MTRQTYLILIRDGKLALSVGTALEDRLTAELAGLGLAAYVGVPAGWDWQVVDFDPDTGAGAMLLPVATARDLVDAIAGYTPWHDYADDAPLPAAGRAARSRRRARQDTAGAAPSLSRRLAVAGVLTPMLMIGMDPTVVAAAAAKAEPRVLAIDELVIPFELTDSRTPNTPAVTGALLIPVAETSGGTPAAAAAPPPVSPGLPPSPTGIPAIDGPAGQAYADSVVAAHGDTLPGSSTTTGFPGTDFGDPAPPADPVTVDPAPVQIASTGGFSGGFSFGGFSGGFGSG